MAGLIDESKNMIFSVPGRKTSAEWYRSANVLRDASGNAQGNAQGNTSGIAQDAFPGDAAALCDVSAFTAPGSATQLKPAIYAVFRGNELCPDTDFLPPDSRCTASRSRADGLPEDEGCSVRLLAKVRQYGGHVNIIFGEDFLAANLIRLAKKDLPDSTFAPGSRRDAFCPDDPNDFLYFYTLNKGRAPVFPLAAGGAVPKGDGVIPKDGVIPNGGVIPKDGGVIPKNVLRENSAARGAAVMMLFDSEGRGMLAERGIRLKESSFKEKLPALLHYCEMRGNIPQDFLRLAYRAASVCLLTT